MSQIDSTLNSASTLVTMDFVRRAKPHLTPHQLMDTLKYLAHPTLGNPIGDQVGAERQLGTTRLELFSLVGRDDLRRDELFGESTVQAAVHLMIFKFFSRAPMA